ncbi:response regulator [Spirosoma sp. BT702]|uniref:Response regulator n=1 Tax=Spirosoma profusum TaxID=2771354 RepID=A0A927ASK4_9BACT|nr:response regulator [Spirosoma profusum]MBD2701415.1 response regulator [Spirosoma profusum]
MAKLPTPRRRKGLQVPILIVEDNADQWLIIRAVLKQCFPEVEPIWINNTAQAIAYLEMQAMDVAKVPRMILSDLYLPRKEDGFALLEFIKQHQFYRKPPVIMLSASEDVEIISAAYALNAASYIIKPGSYHEWLNYFYTFRRYWWEIVTLPLLPQ